MPEPSITAAILIIGNEILSGSTKDENIGVIADVLAEDGVDLREVRIVPDEQQEIISAVDALRAKYTYVLTTGGLGPTHDDVTADSVAAAFGVEIVVNERARAILLERHDPSKLNAARLRMVRIPVGADLIASPVTKAPGFRIENVFVMAGVPQIMVAMLDEVRHLLKSNPPIMARTIDAGRIAESSYAEALGMLARAHPGVSIGSYPTVIGDGFRNSVVLRSRDPDAIEWASVAVETMLAAFAVVEDATSRLATTARVVVGDS